MKTNFTISFNKRARVVLFRERKARIPIQKDSYRYGFRVFKVLPFKMPDLFIHAVEKIHKRHPKSCWLAQNPTVYHNGEHYVLADEFHLGRWPKEIYGKPI